MGKYKPSLSENHIPAFRRCPAVRSQVHTYFLTGPLKVVFAAQRTSCSRRYMGVGPDLAREVGAVEELGL